MGGQSQTGRLLEPVSVGVEQVLVLVPGVNEYDGMRDATIFSENDNSDGAGQHFFAGITGQRNERRALIRFDPSKIPAKSKIVAVSLQLTVSRGRTPPAEINVDMHRLLKDWGEGDKDSGGNEGTGKPSTEGDATWKANFFMKTTWDHPGADFVEAVSATSKAGKTGSKSLWEGDGLIADVQAWVNGDVENFGWILIGDASTRRFNSSESLAPAEFRPTLTIHFTPP